MASNWGHQKPDTSLTRHANSSPRPSWRSNFMMSSAAPHILRDFMPHRRLPPSELGSRSRRTRRVHAELYRLTRDNPLFDPERQSFLSRNYDLKAIADYEIGPEAEVSADRANLAVLQAKRFVAHFENMLETRSSETGTAP